MKTTLTLMLITNLSSPLALACTEISSLPFPISQSGRYCLAANLTASAVNGIQISIGASDVELDLAGHSLRCSVASQNAVSASNGTTISNVRVHGGAIIGCNFAVSLRNCASCAVQDLRLLNNAVGISVSGDGARIEHNQIRNDSSNAGRPAIQLDAYSSLVQDNLISGSLFGLDVNGKDNLIRSNHFASCGNAIRFFAPATYQSNLARCGSNYSGASLTSSIDAGGNK
jgi:Periplasmic copper-binding protein (NosD)